ncbi:hypothetical protein AQUCO_04900209v1 [Aquilegia coerulea]|uniref:Transcription repressor n=1 Tax=Aquilegia coerulea TaxID=218851 RepID=A0A2G5CKG7_AQUCA|nr:hypothetical protein AQUCO_04900209v1 [Aquilegia coerulea]
MLSKNLHLCFTRPTTPDSSPTSKQQQEENHLHHNHSTITSPTRTTTAIATTTTTTTTSSSDLIKNFNSLYDNTPASTSKSLSRTSDDFSTTDYSETESTTAPDFATIFASQRFFFSSPGHSNSIIESSSSSSSTCQSSQSSLSDSPPESSTTTSDTLVAGGVPTPTYSPDPYMDFRRSMQEMVEDRKLSDVTTDWDFLHELLLCYLALNPKHAHKYIIGAFADLLISLMASDESRRREPSDDRRQ